MCVAVSSSVWKFSNEKGSQLLLLLALADNANDYGICFPGIEYLAKKTRMSTRQTMRNLEDLANAGEVIILKKIGRGNTNRYLITSGFTNTELVNTLMFQEGFNKEEAIRIINNVVKIKGDILSKQDIEAQEKVTSCHQLKGDISGVKGDISGVKGDISGKEKVTFSAIKGDISAPHARDLDLKKSSEILERDLNAHDAHEDFTTNQPKPESKHTLTESLKSSELKQQSEVLQNETIYLPPSALVSPKTEFRPVLSEENQLSRRPTPKPINNLFGKLPRDWQPSEELVEQLLLQLREDYLVTTKWIKTQVVRFVGIFVSNGKSLADWDARFLVFCVDEAAQQFRDGILKPIEADTPKVEPVKPQQVKSTSKPTAELDIYDSAVQQARRDRILKWGYDPETSIVLSPGKRAALAAGTLPPEHNF